MAGIDPYRHDVFIKAALEAARHRYCHNQRRPWVLQVDKIAECLNDRYGKPGNEHYDSNAAVYLRENYTLFHRGLENLARLAWRKEIGETDDLTLLYNANVDGLRQCLVAMHAMADPQQQRSFPPLDPAAFREEMHTISRLMGNAIGTAKPRQTHLGDRMRLARSKECYQFTSFADMIRNPKDSWGVRKI